MERLPQELIEKILDLLSPRDICSFSQVNQDWHINGSMKLYYYPRIRNEKKLALFATKITKTSQSYIRVLDFKNVQTYVNDHVILPLLNNVCHLKYLDLSKCTNVSPNLLFQLVKNNMNQLDTLILADCILSTDILECIGKSNQTIDSCHPLESIMNDGGSCSQLAYLDLSYCAWVNSQTVENIAIGLPQLEVIVLQWCNKVKPRSFKVLVSCLKYLKSIDLRHIDSVANEKDIFEMVEGAKSLKKILFTCKRLTTQIML
ncbi:hypothetical protein BD770DRAFT_453173 [Pilaira anomala]|nr:hypothetical protein BD770DRAFT_453173 [Pilaira anomala]